MVDLAIAGGGLVGASFAAAIASHPDARGLSIALVDPHPPAPGTHGAMSLRTSTISPSSREWLEEIGVWAHVPPERVAHFDDMLIWEDDFNNKVRFKDPTGEPLGCVVDNHTLRCAIYERLRSLNEDKKNGSNVALVEAAIDHVVYSPDNNNNWPSLRFNNNNSNIAPLSARLLVACDGARSNIRTRAGLKWFTRPYGQQAVVATVRIPAPITTAYQRFLSTGPLAILPMRYSGDSNNDNVSHDHDGAPNYALANIVWSTTTAEARGLVAASDEQFTRELNIAVHEADEESRGGAGINNTTTTSIPVFTGVHGERGSFPLHCGHAPQYYDAYKRTVLVGDAAHNVHPLAGQGVNLGLADAKALARVVAQAAYSGTDFGANNNTLARYQKARLPANMAMLTLLHSIHTLFSPRKASALRAFGMSILNNAPPAKRAILRMMR